MVAVLAVPALAADPPPKEEKPAADSYVKFPLAVEIKGVLRQSARGFSITGFQEIVRESPGSDFGLVKRDVEKVATTWEVDFGKSAELRKLGEQLKNKPVLVSGTAHLRLVVVENLNRGVRQYPQSTWEVEPRVTVTVLKAASE